MNAPLNLDRESVRRIKMLLVDDSQSILDFIKSEINDEHFEVELLNQPKDLIERLDKLDFEILVLDYHMPEISGIELLKIVRQRYSMSSLPVIMLTSYCKHQNSCLLHQASDFLLKPVDIGLLEKRAMAHVRIKRMLDQSSEQTSNVECQSEPVSESPTESNNSLSGEIRPIEQALINSKINLSVTNLKGMIEFSSNLDADQRKQQQDSPHYDPLLDPALKDEEVRRCIISRLFKKGRWQFESKNDCENKCTYVSTDVSLVYDGNEHKIIIIRKDITDLKEYQLKLEHDADYDRLTDLPNRESGMRFVFNWSKDENRQPIYLLLLDIDNFKYINEIYGYQVADHLLQVIAERLLLLMRSHPLFASRFGGNQFLIVINEADYQNIDRFIQRLNECFGEEFVVDGRPIQLAYSVGIASSIEAKDHPLKLLRMADNAMRKAKLDRKVISYAFYDASFEKDTARVIQIEHELRGAIERDELFMVYQPIVDVENKKIVSAEALIRWHSSKLGPVPPDEFISVAEKSGLIIDIGRFVLKQVIGVLSRLQKHDFFISVNLSPAELVQSQKYFKFLARQLEANRVHPYQIEFEITENMFLEKSKANLKMLKVMAEANYRFAIDDFGTGYSSLQYLVNFDFDKLKIDKSFIQNINDNGRSMSIVKAVISVAKSLGIKITAEGVEDETTFEKLKTLGCDFIQGYYCYKPMPEDQLIALLERTD